MSYDAIVIGGGIVGMSVAYHLVTAGAKTLLLDRDDPGRATDAGAGILTAETNGHASDAWLDFAVAAMDYYPVLIEQLQATGTQVAGAGGAGYEVCGQLAVAVDEDEVELFEAARRWMVAQQQRRGLPAATDLYEISPDEARALFPPLGRVRRALYYRHAARVDGRLLTQAMRQAAVAGGLVVEQASVDRLVIEADAVRGVVTGETIYRAAAVALAGGAWSAHFSQQVGLTIPVRPLKGQIVHLGLPGVATGNWPLVTAYHGHYLVAWPDSRVVIGATQEPEAGYIARPTAAGLHEILREGLRVAPGLAEAEFREVRVGLRPYNTADGMPVLGRVPGLNNLYLATGHGPYGLHLGPYSGKLIADMMRGEAPEPLIAPFHPGRFGPS
jgi:D-amino-acid dehydrogenase